jgi:hypothetical protein
MWQNENGLERFPVRKDCLAILKWIGSSKKVRGNNQGEGEIFPNVYLWRLCSVMQDRTFVHGLRKYGL